MTHVTLFFGSILVTRKLVGTENVSVVNVHPNGRPRLKSWFSFFSSVWKFKIQYAFF